IHMTPEETATAAEDLGARYLLPSHIGKFALAYHPWDDPFKRIVAASQHKNYHLITPMIGEPVNLADHIPDFSHWWEQLG
ncbi:MAG: MBL fold metallo-hydrolase, partial [Mailhella sp.]